MTEQPSTAPATPQPTRKPRSNTDWANDCVSRLHTLVDIPSARAALRVAARQAPVQAVSAHRYLVPMLPTYLDRDREQALYQVAGLMATFAGHDTLAGADLGMAFAELDRRLERVGTAEQPTPSERRLMHLARRRCTQPSMHTRCPTLPASALLSVRCIRHLLGSYPGRCGRSGARGATTPSPTIWSASFTVRSREPTKRLRGRHPHPRRLPQPTQPPKPRHQRLQQPQTTRKT